MQSLPDVAKANGEMEALQKQKENDLKSMQDEFQRKADEYQKGSEHNERYCKAAEGN